MHVQGLYGDIINAVGGYRLQCTDCWRFLDGPVALAKVDRDPDRLLESQEDWSFPRNIGLK